MSATSGSFELRPRGALIPPPDGPELVSFDLDAHGEAVVLWAGDGRPVITHGSEGEAVTLAHSAPEWPLVQLLPDDRLLVVGMRSEWRDGAGEHNAFVFGHDGSLERSGCLGDGIEHVKVAADGTIWVGYFDEGIFGNLGWGMGKGPEPIGHSGLVQFTRDFELLWEFPPSDNPIDDCYAMNVIGDDVWVCCYSEFDVALVRDGAVQRWRNDVASAKTIAVADDRVALFGHWEERDRLVIGHLSDADLKPRATTRLTMPNGRRIPEDARVVGRGAELHVLVGLERFTWSLTDQA
ncbi:hypothetical protein GCM10022234_10940 [Aeromicrobium panaciterrae]|uniref:hypothetical protein n=1 Tax=Aeromicrobium panaciterrae TaxID=363861 RepID=UPI0031D07EFC